MPSPTHFTTSRSSIGTIDLSERRNRIEHRRRERPEGVREPRIAREPEHEPRRVRGRADCTITNESEKTIPVNAIMPVAIDG